MFIMFVWWSFNNRKTEEFVYSTLCVVFFIDVMHQVRIAIWTYAT